jgi:hypothetical protein
MRRSTITEQDEQAGDLEAAANEMRALAEQLRNAPVPITELAAELGEDVVTLTRRVEPDLYRDDVGRKVITRQRARALIAERDEVEEQRARILAQNEAQIRAIGERNDRERRAVLAAVDRHYAKHGATTELGAAASLIQGDRLDEMDAKMTAFTAEEAAKARGHRRYNSDGQLVDSHGNVIP